MTSVSTTDLDGLTEPIPVLTQRPRLRDTFAVLRRYNYRLYVISQLFATTGVWMQRVAVDWLVLELTGSVALVGLTVTLQFAPAILLGPWAGVLADRASRRHVLLATQATSFVICGLVATTALLGVVEAWHLFLAAGVLGVAGAIDGPSRSAFMSQLVGTTDLRNAISLNASVFHLGGLVGPAISGALIVLVGSGGSIAINTVTILIAFLALLFMRTGELVRAPRPQRRRGEIRTAIAYVWRKPTIRWPLLLMGFIAMFGMNLPVLFTAAANEVYGTGAAGYGLYSSLAAAGALLGALLSTRRTTLRLRGVVAATALYGLATALGGLAPWYPMFLAVLLGIGAARLTFMMAAEAMTQLSTNLGIRGRVMSLWITINVGGQAVGGLVMGWIAEHLGGQVAFVVAGGVPLVAAVTVGIVLAVRHQLRLRVDLRSPRRFVQIVRREPRAPRAARSPQP